MLKPLTLAALLIPAPAPMDSVHLSVHPAVRPMGSHMSSIELWTEPEGVLQANDQVRVYFRTEFNAYVTVIRVDTDGGTPLVRSPLRRYGGRQPPRTAIPAWGTVGPGVPPHRRDMVVGRGVPPPRQCTIFSPRKEPTNLE